MRTVWSKADLHVHTTHSDGHAGVEEVLEHAARRTDLEVIAITDHDTIEGALEARTLAREYGIEVVVGEEVSTADGELLALFIEQRLPPGLPAAETIAAVHEQGGLAVAAHPYHRLAPSLGHRDLRRRSSGPYPEWPLDAIETFNAGLQLPGGNRRAATTAGALGLPVLGGSDSHHLGTIGYGHTLFSGRGAADLRTAIELGRTVASGRRWGLLRTAEVLGLIVSRELESPSLAPGFEADSCAVGVVPVADMGAKRISFRQRLRSTRPPDFLVQRQCREVTASERGRRLSRRRMVKAKVVVVSESIEEKEASINWESSG